MLPSGDERATHMVFPPLQSADVIPTAGKGQSLREGLSGWWWWGGVSTGHALRPWSGGIRGQERQKHWGGDMTAPRWLGLTNTEFSLGRADCLLPQGSTWLPATFPALQVLMRQKGMGLSWKTSWRRGRSGWQTSTSMPSPALRSP